MGAIYDAVDADEDFGDILSQMDKIKSDIDGEL